MSNRPVATLLLKRSEVAALLGMRECIDAVETAFREHADGKLGRPGILGQAIDWPPGDVAPPLFVATGPTAGPA